MSHIKGNTAIGWGLVGTGEVSRSFAADLTEPTGSRRSAVSSRDGNTARVFADEFAFARAHEGLDAILSDPDVDVLYIATPHGTHRDIAIQALEAGKHVLIEKPAALNGEQVAEIAAVARQEGLFAMEAMWMKFNLLFRRLFNDIQAGVIGEARSVQASFGLPFPTDSGSRWSAELGGSTLLDQGIYPLTLATAVLGEPIEVIARGRMRPDGVDLSTHVTLEFEGGRFAQLSASMVDFSGLSAAIHGTRGWIDIPVPFWAGSKFLTHNASDEAAFRSGQETELLPTGNGFTPMIEHVNDMVRSGRTESTVNPLEDTLAVFKIMDEIRAQLQMQADAVTVGASKDERRS